MSEAIRTWTLGLVVLVLAVIACAIGFDGWKAHRRADKAEAVSVAVRALIEDEGWVTVTYDDPAHGAALPTACAGVTGKGVVAGKRYTQAECEAMTAKAMLDHALAIQGCIPALPRQTHAAFIRFTYNVGPGAACASTMFKKARAGDLVGACAEIPKWVYAAGQKFPGLVKRRTRERAMCDAGLGIAS